MKTNAWLLVVGWVVAAGSFTATTTAAPPPTVTPSTAADIDFVNNDVTQVSSHDLHACALRNGTVFCWGNNNDGQLGDGTTTRRLTPVRVTVSATQPGFSNTAVTLIAVGYQHTCAVEAGSVYCWGLNQSGALGTGAFTPGHTASPVRVSASSTQPGFTNTAVTAVSLGDAYSCAIEAGIVYCWGDNDDTPSGFDSGGDVNRRDGKLGTASVNASNRPIKVTATGSFPNSGNVTDVSLGRYHTCAVAGGRVFCWGRNGNGYLGTGNNTGDGLLPNSGYSASPQPAVPAPGAGFTNTNVASVSVSYEGATCAVEHGVAFCWGWNSWGRLGDGTTTSTNSAVRVVDQGTFTNAGVTVVQTGYHSCALRQSVIHCWGRNQGGNLGNGTFDDSLRPVPVTASATSDGFTNDEVTSISVRNGIGCALRQGVVYCWGWNYEGQLGDGTISTASPWGHPFPVRVAGGVAAPGQPTVTPGDEQATVTWPAVGGVLEYTVTGAPTGSCTVTAPTTSCTISGLTNGVAHTFTVTATVSGRSSPASPPSVAMTPGVQQATVLPLPPLLTAPRAPATDRVTGTADRASLTLSQQTFAPGAPVVYLATRRTLVDALVAGPAAGAGGGPVFTIGANGLDAATVAEIRRLQPGRIVIMGGDQALPSSLETAVSASLGTRPERIEGADRYATAARLAAVNHPIRTQVVYVATGELLVDAVAGGPAAGLERAPVLLVQPQSIPTETQRELRRLRPDRIVVLGQTDAVSSRVEAMLGNYAPVVERIGGVDRYATAVAVSEQRFPNGADVAYLSVGDDPAFAAVAIPAATVEQGPVLFTRPGCLLAQVADEMRRLDPTRIVALGIEVDDALSLPAC